MTISSTNMVPNAIQITTAFGCNPGKTLDVVLFGGSGKKDRWEFLVVSVGFPVDCVVDGSTGTSVIRLHWGGKLSMFVGSSDSDAAT